MNFKNITVELALNSACITIGTHRRPLRSYAYPRHSDSRKISGAIQIGCTSANTIDVRMTASQRIPLDSTGAGGGDVTTGPAYCSGVAASAATAPGPPSTKGTGSSAGIGSATRPSSGPAPTTSTP